MTRLVLLFTLLPTLALAQEAGGGADLDLRTSALQALGFAINAAGVWFLVRLVVAYMPYLRERVPHVIPLIALMAGPLLNFAGAALSSMLLVTIDFAPLIDALGGTPEFSMHAGLIGGAGAVVGDQFRTQRKRAKAHAPRPRWP